jgi:HEAT repeat protein
MPSVRFLSCVVIAALLTVAAPARAQSNSQEIMAKKPAQLVEILKSAEASEFDKAKACQRLAVVGTAEAVPALVALLPHEHLNVYARFGLEGIPDPAVDTALRKAATKLQGRALTGVLGSIGQRRDAQAVDLLKGLLAHSDAAVASASAGALGRIGTPEAASALRAALGKDSPVKNWIADGCLAGAEVLAAAGKKADAVALYEAVAQADLPKHLRIAALHGQLRLQHTAGKDLLLAQLRSTDEAFFKVGLALAREVRGADIAQALADELAPGKLPAERQALLLRALGDRPQPVPAAVVLAASRSDSAALRDAAIRVLAKSGDASAVTILLDAALSGGLVAETAKEGLKTLPASPAVDQAIVGKLAAADAKAKPVLFELVGARRIAAGEPAVRKALDDSDPALKLAALAAFGQLAEIEDLDLLVRRALAGGNQDEMAAAQAALCTAAQRMGDRDGCVAKLAASLQGASGANQTYLLELIGKVSGEKALATVVAAAKSGDPALKELGTRVLGEWVNADAAPALLDLARNDPEPRYQVRALRGYIRIARQLQLRPETRLDMFRTAMDLAQRPEDKKVALDILTRIPSVQTLELAVSYLGQAGLKNDAADAAVKIAKKVRDAGAVAAAMQKVVAANVGGNRGTDAKQLLDQARAASK